MKYVLGVIGAIVLIFIVFMLIFNRGGDDNNTNKSTVLRSSQLVEFADKNSKVSVTTFGKVVGNESRNGIRVIVTPNERRIEILNTYDDNVIRSSTYPNTQTAYENFLSALSGQSFITGKEAAVNDRRSVCPAGNRYEYDLTEDGDSKVNLWSVSCGIDFGSFAGNGPAIRELFKLQIPEYDRQIVNVAL